MSKIALSSNASGTGVFTIASLGTNTDRTLTLPDATGTFNVSGLANEVPAGSAASPSIYPTGDNNTGIFFPAADTIAFAEGGAEIARFDSSGNLGLGVTPSAWNTAYRAIQFQDGSLLSPNNGSFAILSNAYTDGTVTNRYVKNGFATYHDHYDGTYRWFNAPSGTAGNPITFTQAMTLSANGSLLLNTTDSTSLTNTNSINMNPSISGGANFNHINGTANGVIYARFGYNAVVIGSITQNGTTATAYNTSSDYRLKENVQPMQDALAKIAQLNPVTYTWKSDGSDGQGFIAHELQAIVPDCVVGEKDAVDADGNPQYQGIDTSFLVATLVKAVQEQQATITALEARIAALENIQ
jgi:hypothetical protein